MQKLISDAFCVAFYVGRVSGSVTRHSGAENVGLRCANPTYGKG